MSKGIKKAIQQLDAEIAYHCLMNDIEPRSSYIELGNQIERASTKEDLFYIYGRLEAFAEGYNLKVEPLKFHKKKDKKSFWGDYGDKRAKKIVRYFRISLTVIWAMAWITLFILSATGSNWEEHQGERDYCCPYCGIAIIVLLGGGVGLEIGVLFGGETLYEHLEKKYEKLRRKSYA